MPREIFLVLNLLALFIITYILVDMFYNVISIRLYDIGAPKIELLKGVEIRKDKAMTAPEYAMIVKRNIFGATEKVAPPPLEEKVEQVAFLQETSLQLSLLGTIAGDTERARAIILDQRARSQDIYKVGDSVQETVIKQILRGKIVLHHGEKDEMLTMAKADDILNTDGTGDQKSSPYQPAIAGYQTPLYGKQKAQFERETLTAAMEVHTTETEELEKRLIPEDDLSAAPAGVQYQAMPVTEILAPWNPAPKAMAKVQEPTPIPAAELSDFTAVEPFISAWAGAWKQKDIATYLSHYSGNFSPPGGMSRAAWEKQRHERLGRPLFINIDIREMRQDKENDSGVQVAFIQEYQSDIYSDKVLKTLDLTWENGGWMIIKESSRALEKPAGQL